MKVPHLARAAAGALGEDAHAAHAALEIVRGGEDGLEGVAVVLPVDGQEARRVGDVPDHGDGQVGGLGHEGQILPLQKVEDHQRVKEGAVVADQQIGGLGQLLHPGEPGDQAAVGAEQAVDPPDAGHGAGELPLQGLGAIHLAHREPVEGHEEHMQHKLRPQEDGDAPPQGEGTQQRQPHGQRQGQQEEGNGIDHGRSPPFAFFSIVAQRRANGKREERENEE